MAQRAFDDSVKILMLGDSGVGKSSLLSRFAEDKFSTNFVTTIGVDFKMKIIDITNRKVRIQVWDTAGQERFRTITPAYYRSVMGVIIAYDITNKSSFENVNYWMTNLNEHAAQNICKILIANKSDLEDKRQVTKEEGAKLAAKFNIKFFECSAKSNQNVMESFLDITNSIMNTHDTSVSSNSLKVQSSSNGNQIPNNKKCCK